jgi:AcrR family transcriptional regulator
VEFARRPYGEVSINRIIQGAEIPRGSFYQYFADKTDLFRYVLRGCDNMLEEAIMKSLAACGGRPLEIPLALYDLVLDYIRENWAQFELFMGILQKNMGMDAGQLLSLPEMVLKVINQADWRGLEHLEADERLAVMDLLFSAAGHALMAVFCEKLSSEESRRRLAIKTAVIQRGARYKEEPSC